MEAWKRDVIRRKGYKLLGKLDLEPQLRSCLYAKYLISESQYQLLVTEYESGHKMRAAEMCLQYIPNAGRVDECPFDLFIGALEETVELGGSSSNGDVAKCLLSAASDVVESGKLTGFSHSRSQSLVSGHSLDRSLPTTPRKFHSEPEINRVHRVSYPILIIGDKFCTSYFLEPYIIDFNGSGEIELNFQRNTHSGTPYSYVTLNKQLTLYGKVEVHLIGYSCTDGSSATQVLKEVLQHSVALPLCGAILLVDICRDDETVMSELSRLEDVLCDTLVKCPQVRRVLVPAASNTAMKGFQRTPESQQLIRCQAKQLGIHGFCSNLSEAITDIVSHHVDCLLLPDGEGSQRSSVNSSKAVQRAWHQQKRHCRMECQSVHSGSVSDAESRDSDDGENSSRRIPIKQRTVSALPQSLRPYKGISSSTPTLDTIPQSPPNKQILCDDLPVTTMSRDDPQLNIARNDDQSLANGLQPTDCLDGMASEPMMLPVETATNKQERRRTASDANCEQDPYYTATHDPDIEDVLLITVTEEHKRRMTESAPAMMGNGHATGSSGNSQPARRCSIL